MTREEAARRNTMQNELRECPFCGNLHVLLRNIEYDKTLWIIECNVCHTEFTVKRVIAGKKKDNRSRVIEAWNRRVSDED